VVTRRGWLSRTVRTLALGLGACLLAGLAAFGTVRYLTQGLHVVPAVSPQLLEQSRILRSLNNEIVLLAHQYLAWFDTGDAPHRPAFTKWNETAFRPRVNHLRTRLDVLPYQDRTTRTLRAAADRVAAMSAHPADTRLREQAMALVREAATAVEEQIEAWNTGRFLGEPVHRPRF